MNFLYSYRAIEHLCKQNNSAKPNSSPLPPPYPPPSQPTPITTMYTNNKTSRDFSWREKVEKNEVKFWIRNEGEKIIIKEWEERVQEREMSDWQKRGKGSLVFSLEAEGRN